LSIYDPNLDDKNVINDSVQPSTEKIDDQKGGVPDVGTSLGQHDERSKDTGTHDEDESDGKTSSGKEDMSKNGDDSPSEKRGRG